MNTVTLPFVNYKSLFIGALILVAAGLTLLMTPGQKIEKNENSLKLEMVVPERIGEWQIDKTVVPILPDPSAVELIKKIYSQTLSRTYYDASGYRIMLSIAYGGAQTDELKAHRPDVCYPAQGFQIKRPRKEILQVGQTAIPVARMESNLGARYEPVTYWIAVAGRATATDIQRKLAQIRIGITGVVPDGMLIRVSSIDKKPSNAYAAHDRFIRDLAGVLDHESLKRFGLGIN